MNNTEPKDSELLPCPNKGGCFCDGRCKMTKHQWTLSREYIQAMVATYNANQKLANNLGRMCNLNNITGDAK